jgi:hypothetical protein
VLYECLAGQAPFVHHSEAVVLELHQREPPPDVSRRRPEAAPFAETLTKAMSKKPDDRWQTAHEMRQAMNNAAKELQP